MLTIDRDPEAIATCRRATRQYETVIEYVASDSLEFLRSMEVQDSESEVRRSARSSGSERASAGRAPEPQSLAPIGFLYLDSLDYEDREASEAHHRAEAEAALPHLAHTCLVLFDDTVVAFPDASGDSVDTVPGFAGTRDATGEPASTEETVLESDPPPRLPPPEPGADRAAGSPRGAQRSPRHFTGKGAQAVPWLLEQGFAIDWATDGQVLLSRGADGLPPPEPAVSDAIPASRHEARWRRAVNAVPLGAELAQFRAVTASPGMGTYLAAILRLCRAGDRTVEGPVEQGYPTIWLSTFGLAAEGVDPHERVVERAKAINDMSGTLATFRVGDPFGFVPGKPARVIHHYDQLHRFPAPVIRGILAAQTGAADYVVCSVPTVYASLDGNGTDERLLPREEWDRLLSGFAVESVQEVGRERLVVVVRGGRRHGREPDEFGNGALLDGIAVIVLARNEGHQIAACLTSALPVAAQLIVCDMESEDDTVEIARSFGAEVVHHPRVADFDRARNVAAMRARYRWILFLDADERLPEAFARLLLGLVARDGHSFAGVQFPFRHRFLGSWLPSLYPGYKAPSLLRNGAFYYYALPHAGVAVEGRVAVYPPDNPEHAIEHLSYPTVRSYLEKMAAYTQTEAAALYRRGEQFHWQKMARAMAADLHMYMDRHGTKRDGARGVAYALEGMDYPCQQWLQLYELRLAAGELTAGEDEAPASAEAFLEFMLAVLREKTLGPAPIRLV